MQLYWWVSSSRIQIILGWTHPGCADRSSAQGEGKDSPLSSVLISPPLCSSALTELRKMLKMGVSHLCSLVSSGLSGEAPWIGFYVISVLTDCRKR